MTGPSDDSTAHGLLSQYVVEHDIGSMDDATLRSIIRAHGGDVDSEPWPTIRFYNPNRPSTFLPALDAAVNIRIDGDLGDYAFSYQRLGECQLYGNAGIGVCDGMTGGAIRIRGDVGDGAGCVMRGGTLAVYGSAGDRVAAGMTGGELFVRGSVGEQCGYAATGGTIVIGGSAGDHLGCPVGSTTIFIRGNVESLAPGMVEAPLRKQNQLKLGMLLMAASIKGSSKDFRRIISQRMLDNEKNERGEVNPSWR